METTTVVIGAGHAGLAMSRRLSQRSIDHVVLERGEVANSWRTERWDSLRMLTPNWLNRLPGLPYQGPEPDGFSSMPGIVELLSSYANHVDAPVQTGTTVTRLTRTETGYRVVTDRGVWTCRTVVLASGAANVSRLPACAGGLDSSMIEDILPRLSNQSEIAACIAAAMSASDSSLVPNGGSA